MTPEQVQMWVVIAFFIVNAWGWVWAYWFIVTHWPADGFVKISPEYAQARDARAARAESMPGRTVSESALPLRSTVRIKKARMSGRRMHNRSSSSDN